MKKNISLATSVARITAVVIAVAMLIYAIYQYVVMPDMTIAQLFVGHLWHVIVLGVLTYFVLQVMLKKKVVEPVQQLYVKFYGISRGDYEPINIESNIREIQDIAESINLILLKKEKRPSEPLLLKLRNFGGTLRVLIRKLSDTLDDADRTMLMHIISETEDLIVKLEHTNKTDHKDVG